MSFRKIDVDAYDEDVLQETELYDPDPREPTQVLSDTKQKQLAVRSALTKCVSLSRVFVTYRLVRRGDIAGALGVALDNPPYGPGVDEAKVRLTLLDHDPPLIIHSETEPRAPNRRLRSQQHQIDGRPHSPPIALPGRTRYADEVHLQGDGHARVGRRQRERVARVARKGAHFLFVMRMVPRC